MDDNSLNIANKLSADETENNGPNDIAEASETEAKLPDTEKSDGTSETNRIEQTEKEAIDDQTDDGEENAVEEDAFAEASGEKEPNSTDETENGENVVCHAETPTPELSGTAGDNFAGAAATVVAPEKEKVSFGRVYGHFTLVFGSLLVFIIASNLFYLAASIIIRAFFPQFAELSVIELIVSSASMYCAGFPAAVIMLLFAKKEPQREKKSITFGKWLKLFCITSAVMYVGSLIAKFINSFIVLIPGATIRDVVGDMLSGDAFWLSAVISVVAAPLVEEIIFRKMFIDRLRGHGEKFAIFVSALCFGLFHGNFSQFFYAFGVGLIFGYIYSKTGKIWYTISLHAATNFFFGVLTALVSDFAEGLMNAAEQVIESDGAAMEDVLSQLASIAVPALVMLLFGLLTIALVICGVVFFILEVRKKLSFEPARYELNRGKLSAAALWTNVGFWLFTLYSAYAFYKSIF